MEKDSKIPLLTQAPLVPNAPRDAKGRLLPGATLNPGGAVRMKGLADKIRAATNGGKEIIERILSISRGEPQYVPNRVRMPDGTYVETQGQPMARLVKGEEADRATYYLADHVFGKAPQSVQVEQTGGNPLFPPGKYPLSVLEAIAAVVGALKTTSEPVIDAEVTEITPDRATDTLALVPPSESSSK